VTTVSRSNVVTPFLSKTSHVPTNKLENFTKQAFIDKSEIIWQIQVLPYGGHFVVCSQNIRLGCEVS